MINLKKIVILLLCLMLTGCFENSGYLVKSCTKEEKADTLTNITTYTFGFKNDIIEDLRITFDYQDTQNSTIKNIKQSLEMENNYYKLVSNVIIDDVNHYKVEYQLPLEANDEIKEKYIIKTSRTDLVNLLKSKGFVCE